MNTLKYLFVTLFVLGTLGVTGQSRSGAAQFPDITPDTRGVAMGNTGTATTADAFSIYRNAAKSIFSDKKAEAAYSFTPWMRDLVSGSNFHGAAGYYNLDEKQGITVGFRWFSHAEIGLTDDTGKSMGTFTPKDWSVEVGYTRKLIDRLSVGATAHFVRSDMSGMDKDAIANAVAFDLGMYYQGDLAWNEQSHWAVGLQLANFGMKIDYGYGKYDQPAKVSLGGMIDYWFVENHQLQGTLDFGYNVLPSDNTCYEAAIGAEYTLYRLVSVRGGYHYGELNNQMQRYGTVGCGVNYRYVRADVAYLLPETNSFLKNTWQVSLGIDLGFLSKK